MIDITDNDNWLEKERIRESRVSAWDFDDGKKLRNDHADNCDVELLAKQHRRVHEGTLKNYTNVKKSKSVNNTVQRIKWLFISCLALIGFFLIAYYEDYSVFGLTTYITVLFFGVISSIIFKRRLPNVNFFQILLFICAAMEIPAILAILYYFIRFY